MSVIHFDRNFPFKAHGKRNSKAANEASRNPLALPCLRYTEGLKQPAGRHSDDPLEPEALEAFVFSSAWVSSFLGAAFASPFSKKRLPSATVEAKCA